MYRFWDTVIAPLLEITQPRSILEIGSEYGPNTRNLLEFCEKNDARLHVVDPAPKYDVARLQEKHGERFVFHKNLSLEVLPRVDGFDMVLIDGDHNWYTVYNELKAIESRSAELSRPFPIVMLHDVDWPYGRRDLYYAPETIPEEHRQPHARKGMRYGVSELLEEGGLNQHILQATHEGGPRNGVLTAVEDFLEETGQQLEFYKLPALHGVGILVPSRMRDENEKLAGFLRTLDLAPLVSRHLERVNEAWLDAETRREEVQISLRGVQSELSTRKRAESRGSEESVSQLRKRLERQQQAAKRRAREVERLASWAEELDKTVTELQRSPQWKAASATAGLKRRALRQNDTPTAEDRLNKIVEKFRNWKSNREQAGNQNGEQEK